MKCAPLTADSLNKMPLLAMMPTCMPSMRAKPHTSVLPKRARSEEHTSELQSPDHLVCRLLLEQKNIIFFFFFNDTATTEIYTLSLHDALPICPTACLQCAQSRTPACCQSG